MKLTRKIMKEMVRNGIKYVENHSPTILTGLVAAGVVTSVGMGIRATVKAIPLIEEEKVRRCKEGLDEHMSAADVVKTCWKCYIPTASMAALTVACAVGANAINLQRNAALATLYSASSTALKEYEDKVVDAVGADANDKIKTEAAKERIGQLSADDAAALGNGNVWMYDTFSGRKWPCNVGRIKASAGDFNTYMANSGDWVSLNEFYNDIGLKEIAPGDSMGFNIAHPIEVWFSAQLEDNGQPIVAMDFKSMPKLKYELSY